MNRKLTNLLASSALVLTPAFTASAEQPAQPAAKNTACNVSLTVEPNLATDDNYWPVIDAIRADAAKEGVILNALVYPTSGKSSVHILRDRTRGEYFSLAELPVAAQKVIQECKDGGATRAVTVSTPSADR